MLQYVPSFSDFKRLHGVVLFTGSALIYFGLGYMFSNFGYFSLSLFGFLGADMDSFMTEAAKQVPALTVLVAVVVYFLKYLERVQASHRETFKEVAIKHAEASLRQAEALADLSTRQTEAFAKNTEILAKVAYLLDRVSSKNDDRNNSI